MTRPVYPICPSFKDGDLELKSTKKYLSYLEKEGATRVLTTAGTSQFNLLSVKEVFYLNRALIKYFNKEKILGLPIQSLKHTLKEIKALNNLKAKNTSILIIFPERYYNDDQVVKYFEVIWRKYRVFCCGRCAYTFCYGS